MHKEHEDVVLAILGGQVDGQLAVAGLDVLRRAKAQQLLHNIQLAVARGPVQWRPAILRKR